MSEDKDGADIEDVLSSIRRLVAKTAPAQTVSSAERRGALRAATTIESQAQTGGPPCLHGRARARGARK